MPGWVQVNGREGANSVPVSIVFTPTPPWTGGGSPQTTDFLQNQEGRTVSYTAPASDPSGKTWLGWYSELGVLLTTDKTYSFAVDSGNWTRVATYKVAGGLIRIPKPPRPPKPLPGRGGKYFGWIRWLAWWDE